MKGLFAFLLMISSVFVPFLKANAGTNVNSSDNSILCKGQSSCSNLKTFCKGEKGTFTESDEYGKCKLPATQSINDFKDPNSSNTETPIRLRRIR